MKLIVSTIVALTATLAFAEIEVDGVGTVETRPDLALTTFSFTVRDTDLGKLAESGSKKLADVTNEISKVKGVLGFRVEHSRVGEVDSFSSSREGMPKVFERSYAIQLQTTPEEVEAMRVAQFGLDNDLSLTGEHRFSSDGLVMYALRDYQSAYEQALRKALENARFRAETVAGLSGLTVGSIKSVNIVREGAWNSPRKQGFEFTSNEPIRVLLEVTATVTFESTPKSGE